MSVEVTRLPSGLTVVTDAMPHLESASLGVWVGAGSRDERPDEHGISHLLEHMAFKGTKRRTARQIAEEIEAVGGDLNAATSVETTSYYARVLRADVPLAIDVLSDILSDPAFDPEELQREQNVIVQEIGAAEDAPDDLVFDKLQETAFPGQSVGRSILGTRETVRSFDRSSSPPISRATIAPPTWWWLPPARSIIARWSTGRAAVRELRRAGGAGAGARAFRRRHLYRDARSRTGAYGAGDAGPAAARSQPVQHAGLHQRARRRHVVAAVPGGARDPRALLFDLRVPRALFGHRHVRPLCRHRRRRRAGADARRGRRDRQCGRDHHRSRDRPRQGADEGGPPDGAGKFGRAHRAACAPDVRLGPPDPAGRAGGEDRSRDGRERARRRTGADRARPAGDRGARVRART